MAHINRQRLGGYACVAVTAVFVLSQAAHALGAPPLILLERGVSMPTGVYRLAGLPPVKRGDIIMLRDAPNWSRPYLLKRVAGMPGDLFCWHGGRQQHWLVDRWLPGPSSRARELDVPVWRGCRRLEEGEVVGLADHPDSYDSRAFGPIRERDISGIYRLALAVSSQRARPAPAE